MLKATLRPREPQWEQDDTVGDYSCAVCGFGMKEPCEHFEPPSDREELLREARRLAGDVITTFECLLVTIGPGETIQPATHLWLQAEVSKFKERARREMEKKQ